MVGNFPILFLLFAIFFAPLVTFYFSKNFSFGPLLAEISSIKESLKNLEKNLESIESKNLEEKINKLEAKIANLENKSKKENKKELVSLPEKSKEEKICQNFDGVPKREVIFNEICWMGTQESPTHEWIELKNISKREIDLEGWQILNKDQKIKIVFKNLKIGPGQILLLERGDDETLPDVDADLIYEGALKNKNEAIFLFDKDCNLQDKVEATTSWPAGDSKTKRTMERREDFSWQTSESPGGTPKAENSKGFLEKIEEKKSAKIKLDFPAEVFSQREFEVLLSVSDLNYDTYDVKISVLKISDEPEAKRTISEISLNGKDWQNSFNYLTKVFTGSSFSGNFKLRILAEFSGEAEILAKVRNQNTIVAEYSGKIKVKTQSPKEIAPKEKETLSKTYCIDINTAPASELEKLVGVGPTIAQRIIEARPFSSVDDLIRVKGIGEKTLQKIKEQGLACVK